MPKREYVWSGVSIVFSKGQLCSSLIGDYGTVRILAIRWKEQVQCRLANRNDICNWLRLNPFNLCRAITRSRRTDWALIPAAAMVQAAFDLCTESREHAQHCLLTPAFGWKYAATCVLIEADCRLLRESGLRSIKIEREVSRKNC